MGTSYQWKPFLQRLLVPWMNRLNESGVSPNQVTLFTFSLSALGGLILWLGRDIPWILILPPFLLLVRMVLNALDGMMAKSQNAMTPLGEVMNEVGDVLSDACLYIPMVHYVGIDYKAIVLMMMFVFLAFVSEFCGVLAKAMMGERRYDGPMGKSDRAILVGGYCLLLYTAPILVKFWIPTLIVFAICSGIRVFKSNQPMRQALAIAVCLLILFCFWIFPASLFAAGCILLVFTCRNRIQAILAAHPHPTTLERL